MITSGKNPMAMAATVVYLASIMNNEKVSQTQVSKAASISSVTIRNLCKNLKDSKIVSFSSPKLVKNTEKKLYSTIKNIIESPRSVRSFKSLSL